MKRTDMVCQRAIERAVAWHSLSKQAQVTAALDSVAQRALAPVDRLRALWLHLLGRCARRLIRVRTERVGWQAALLSVASLTLALTTPLLLLTWGPLILGVPHLVSDVRYLVVRQGLAQRRLLCASVACCLLGANLAPSRGYGIAAIACAGLLARGSRTRRALAAAGCLCAWLWTRGLGGRADVIFAHAHNLVAVLCWALWARGRRTQLVPALGICCLGCWLVLSGATDPILFHSHALDGGRFTIDARRLASELAPVSEPLPALRWTICFAFLQSVHYGVWLRSLPDEDRDRPGLRSFVSSYGALRRDVGPWLLVAALLLVCSLCIAASLNTAAARSGYLQLARFHGPLELAVLVLLWVEARAPRRAGSCRAT